MFMIVKSIWKVVVSWFNGLDLHLWFARNKTILNNISCGCPTGASLKYSLKRRAFGYWRRRKPQFNSTQCHIGGNSSRLWSNRRGYWALKHFGKLDFCLLWQSFHWAGMALTNGTRSWNMQPSMFLTLNFYPSFVTAVLNHDGIYLT